MFERIYPQNWVELSQQVRVHLAKVFDIPRSGISEVRDMTLVSDGHTNEDLKAITLEKMNEYIGSEETYPRAWEITLSKVNYELNPPVQIHPTTEPNMVADEVEELPEVTQEKDEKTTTKKSK